MLVAKSSRWNTIAFLAANMTIFYAVVMSRFAASYRTFGATKVICTFIINTIPREILVYDALEFGKRKDLIIPIFHVKISI